MSYECGCYVSLKRVGTLAEIGRVSKALSCSYLVDEVERDLVALVKVNCVFCGSACRILERDVNLSRINCGIPDPEVVDDTSVLASCYGIIDVSSVHKITLSKVVGSYHGVSVVSILPSQESVTSESLVFECEVEGRCNVLSGQNLDVRLLLLLC